MLFLLFLIAGDTGGARGAIPHPHPTFCAAKRKTGSKRKKERVSKQKLLKGCYQGQNVILIAVLERPQFKNF